MEKTSKLSTLALLLGGLALSACNAGGGTSTPANTSAGGSGIAQSSVNPSASAAGEHAYRVDDDGKPILGAADDSHHGYYCTIHETYESLSEHHMVTDADFPPEYDVPQDFDEPIYFKSGYGLFNFIVANAIYHYCGDGCGYVQSVRNIDLEKALSLIGQVQDKEAFVQGVENADLSDFDYAAIRDYPNGERSGLAYAGYRAKPSAIKHADWVWARQAYVGGPWVLSPKIQHAMGMFDFLIKDHLIPHIDDFEIYDICDYHFARGSYGDHEVKLMFDADYVPCQYHYIEKDNGEIVKNEGVVLQLGHSEDTIDGVPDFYITDQKCWEEHELTLSDATFFKATIPTGSFIGPYFGLVESVRNEEGELTPTSREFYYGQIYGCYSVAMREGDEYTFGYAVNSRYDYDPYGTVRYAKFTGEEGLAEAKAITKDELNTKTRTKDDLEKAYGLSSLVNEIDAILEKAKHGKYTILAHEYEPAKFEYYVYFKDGTNVWIVKADFKEYYVFDENDDFSDLANARRTYIASSANYTGNSKYSSILNHLTGLWTHN